MKDVGTETVMSQGLHCKCRCKLTTYMVIERKGGACEACCEHHRELAESSEDDGQVPKLIKYVTNAVEESDKEIVSPNSIFWTKNGFRVVKPRVVVKKLPSGSLSP